MANKNEDGQKKPGMLKRMASFFRGSNITDKNSKEDLQIGEPQNFRHAQSLKQDSAGKLAGEFTELGGEASTGQSVSSGEVNQYGYGRVTQYSGMPHSGSRSSEGSSLDSESTKESPYQTIPMRPAPTSEYGPAPSLSESQSSESPYQTIPMRPAPTSEYGPAPSLSESQSSVDFGHTSSKEGGQYGPAPTSVNQNPKVPPPVPSREGRPALKSAARDGSKHNVSSTIQERQEMLKGAPLGGFKPSSDVSAPGHESKNQGFERK